MVLILTLLGCQKDNQPIDSAEETTLYPYRGEIASGNIPKVYVDGEEIPVTEIQPTVLNTITNVCPIETTSYTLDNGDVVIDTALASSHLQNLTNTSLRYQTCYIQSIDSFAVYSGYSSILPESGLAETLDYNELINQARSLSSDSDVWPEREKIVPLENGSWLIPYVNRDTGVAGFLSHDISSNQTSLIYETTIPLFSADDDAYVTNFSVKEGLIIINCHTTVRDSRTSPYQLTKTIILNIQDGTLILDKEWYEEPILSSDTTTIEGDLFSDLSDLLEVNLTNPIYDNGYLYMISTPILGYGVSSEHAFQAAPSVLIRYDVATESREEISLNFHGIHNFFYDDVSEEFVVIGSTNPILPEEADYISHVDFSLAYIDLETGELSTQQVLLTDQDYSSVNLVPRTLQENEYIWNNQFVVQYSTREPDLEIWHDYYVYNQASGTYEFSHTENSVREIDIEDFEYTNTNGENFLLSPSQENAITFQSDEVIFKGYNRDYVYVNPVDGEAFYFRNLTQSSESCLLFEVGGEIYSSCSREAGRVTLKGDYLFVAIEESVLKIQTP